MRFKVNDELWHPYETGLKLLAQVCIANIAPLHEYLIDWINIVDFFLSDIIESVSLIFYKCLLTYQNWLTWIANIVIAIWALKTYILEL